MRTGLVSVGLFIILAIVGMSLPVSAQDTPTPTTTPCVAFELLSDHTWRQSNDCNIVTPTQEVFPTETSTPTPDTNCYYTTQDNVNIRSLPVVTLPGQISNVIYTVTATKNPTVLGLAKYQGTDFLWLKVNAGGHVGWTVSQFWVDNGKCAALPFELPFLP